MIHRCKVYSTDIIEDEEIDGAAFQDAFVFDVSLFSVATVAEEEHFWPSADAFGVYCLCSESVNMCKFFGLQRTVLRELCSCGSFAFSEPQHFLSDCATAMLGPTSSLDQSVQPSDIAFQKKALLSVALEYGLQSVCTSCANSWISEGGIVLLIDWIELKIAELVLEKDKLWKHLLSANPLELSEIHVGHKLISSMEQVACILDTVIVLSQKTLADLDYSKLVLQLRLVTVQCRVLKVMMWFVKKKILPFMLDYFNEPSELSSLSKCYSALRHSAEHHGLAVDYLYSELMDMPLQEDQSSGYPPSSVDHFVMLLSGLNTTPQHCIMVYFLCDMAKLQEQENVIEFASSYVMEFGIPPHLSAMAFGLWCLDNRNFEDSLNYLLSSAAVRLFPWQHFAILWALLHAEHFRGAVRYIQAHCNDLSSVEDSLLMVNVLIASGCVSTAFQVVCKNEDASLLTHFLEQCLLGGKLHSVLQLPMDLFHQELVCTFLEQQSSVDAQLMLVAFCLQNSRHAQAMHAYEKVKPMAKTSHDPRIRQQFKLLSSLLSGYFSVLPKPLQSVVSHPVTELPPALSPTVKPLTTVVREGSREMSKVDLIHAVMENTSKAIRSEIMETPSPFRKREAEYLNEVPYTPFISTPASTRKAKRFCTHTPKTSERSSVMGVTDSVVPLDNSITKLKRHMQCFKDRISVLDHRSMAFDVSVFKTPLLEKVTQKTPSQGKEEAEPPSAPHSILKVKQEDMDTTACMDLTDVRPDEARQSVPRKIRFAVEGNLIPSPVSPATEKGLQVQALSLITPLPHDSSEEFLSPAESPSQLSPVATTHDIKLSSEKLFSEFKNPTPIQTGDEGFSKVQDTALSSDSKDDDKHSFIAAAAEDKKKKKETENILPRKELWVKKELTSESERVKQEVKEHYSLRTLRKGDDSGASSSVFTVPPVTTTHSTQLHVPTPASKKKKVPSHSLLTPVVKLDMSKQGTSLAERKAKILNVNEASVTSTVSTVGGQPSATMANPQRSQRLKTLRPRNPTKKVFSDPVPLAAPSTRHKEESVSTPKTTPFVFSPPLTRSRAKVPATDYSNSSKVVATPSTRGRAMREASGQPDTAATSESTPQQLASVSRRNQAVVKSVKLSASSTAARRSTRLLRNKK